VEKFSDAKPFTDTEYKGLKEGLVITSMPVLARGMDKEQEQATNIILRLIAMIDELKYPE